MQLKNIAAATLLAAVPALAQDCLTITNTPPGTDLMLGDDQTVSVPLPFSFPFNNMTFDAISVCSNGYIWLGIETEDDFSASEAEFLAEGPRIAPCWDDLQPNAASVPAGGGIFFNQSASQVSVAFKDIPYWGSTTDFVNMEVVLTATGDIYVHYEANHTIATGTSLVGITAGGAATANPIDVSAGAALAGSTGYEFFAANTMDLVGTTQHFGANGFGGFTLAATTLPTCAQMPGPSLALADATAFGDGCPSPATGTWFELFTASTLDVNGLSLLLSSTGTNTYSVGAGAGFDTSFGPGDAVILSDDDQVNVSCAAMGGFPFQGSSITAVDLVSNGYMWLVTNPSTDASATAAEFASADPRIAPCWMDFDPSSGGTVYWTETAAFAMATWEDVPVFGNTTLNTMQCKLFPNGDIEMTWVTMDNNSSVFEDAIIGVSGGASNPAPQVDVSNGSGSFDVTPDLTAPLTHVADSLPVIGTDYDLTTNDLPTGSLFGATLIGLTQLNNPLDGFGAPGCTQYADNLSVFLNVIAPAQTTFTNTLSVPFSLAFVGLPLVSQGAAYVPGVNPLGAVTSNGVAGTVGL